MTTVIIPVLGDRPALELLLQTLPPAPGVEIVVVDGGADRALEALCAGRPDARVLRTRPGRGHQMNTGAAAARGDWLLFLHADSALPPEWRQAIDAADRDPASAGGWFRFGLDDDAWQARAIERLVAWRVALCRLPYGDQGIFVRRQVFDALGGYREMPLMEDVEFVRRLRRAVGSSRVDLQACKLEYSIVSPK